MIPGIFSLSEIKCHSVKNPAILKILQNSQENSENGILFLVELHHMCFSANSAKFIRNNL